MWAHDDLVVTLDDAPSARALVGQKAGNLAAVAKLGVPVPRAFVLTTRAFARWREHGDAIDDALEAAIRAQLDALAARLVSVRSGAAVSMPGAMTTVLAVPADPPDQVMRSIDLVFRSWDSPGARAFRRERAIPDDVGTAVIVQCMVAGDRDERSGSGLVATRDPTTGARALTGGFLLGRRGDDIVGPDGPAALRPIGELGDALPEAARELERCAALIEAYFGWPQDLEITIESGRLWILQARAAPLAPAAAVRVAVHMVREGLLTPEQALDRVPPMTIDAVRRRRFAPEAVAAADREGRRLAAGLAAAPGVATGPLVIAGEPRAGVLVRAALDPVDDLDALQRADGLVTARGGTASHAATLARLLGRPYVTGCDRLEVDAARRVARFGGAAVSEGATVSLDGDRGAVYLGALATELAEPPPELAELEAWQRAHRAPSAWLSGCYADRGEPAVDHRARARAVLAAARWHTAKAIAVDLVREVLPEALRIPQFVVAARDRAGLRALMLEGLARGHWIGLRPCHSVKTFGKGTWQMAIQSADEVDRYLAEPDFQGRLKAGGYPRWIADDTLEEIICVWDPPGKGLPELADHELAFAVSCVGGEARVELVLGTSQVRYLEGAASDRLIHLRMELDPSAPRARGRRTVQIGRAHEGDRRAQSIAQAVGQAVFVDWWDPPIELPHVMSALDGEVGLHGLEFQGRARGEAVEYMLLFDVKGAEESRLLAAVRP